MVYRDRKFPHFSHKPNRLTLRFDMSTVQKDKYMHTVREELNKSARSYSQIDAR